MDCMPERAAPDRRHAQAARRVLGCGEGNGGEAVRLIAVRQATGNGRARLGDALAAAGAKPGLAAQLRNGGDSAVDGGADVAVGDGFTDANYHGAYCERECE